MVGIYTNLKLGFENTEQPHTIIAKELYLSFVLTHGRRRNFSRGVDKKNLSGRGTTKKTQGGGLFSKLRVWAGRRVNEKFSCATAIFEQNVFKK